MAESLGLGVALQLWGPDGSLPDSAGHVSLLAEHLKSDVVRIDDVPVLTGDIDDLVAVAGPVSAWSDLTGGGIDEDPSAQNWNAFS